MRIFLIGALALGLGGCQTFGQHLTVDDQVKLINALAAAGCITSGSVTAGASTGQIGGQASFGFTFSGNCDPTKMPAVVKPVQ